MTGNARTSWPDRDLLLRVVQAPAQHFDDPDLQASTFTRGRLNLPQAWSGGRAIVFQTRNRSGEPQAIRFFLAPNATAEARYEALVAHVTDTSGAIVSTQWCPRGLVLGDERFPFLRMRWVSGNPLDRHLDDVLRSSDGQRWCAQLAEQWRATCEELRNLQVAHGDIHAGNILIEPIDGRVALRLVDYDNVWVPGLAVTSREDGHPSFRHPTHDPSHWGPGIDAFANALVYLSLRAVAADPGLWRHHRTDDALIFTRSDLLDPAAPVWGELRVSHDPSVRALTDTILGWLAAPPDVLASLEEALRARPPQPPTSRVSEPEMNVWPPREPEDRADDHQTWGAPGSAGPRPTTSGTGPVSAAPAGNQRWGPPHQPPPITPPPSGDWMSEHPRARTALVILAICVLVVLLGVLL